MVFSSKSNHFTDNASLVFGNATGAPEGINTAPSGPASHSGHLGACHNPLDVDVHEQTEIDVDATILVTDPKYKSPILSSEGHIIQSGQDAGY